MNRKLSIALSAFGVALLTFLVFLPTRGGAFLNWDDDALILQNADFRGFGWTQLRWMFTTTYMGHYQPLTWLSFALNFDVGQLNPSGYHLVNICLHAINAALALVVTWKILAVALSTVSDSARLVASIIGALFFAIHPLRVESVAWITERRDVLSSLFLLASTWAWLNFVGGSRRTRLCYVLSVAFLGLSLLSKAWGMTFFVVLLILDVYPLRRWSRVRAARLLSEKLPFLVLGLAAAAMALRAQTASVHTASDHDWKYRALQSVYGLSFYPCKTLLPIGLSPIYEHPARWSITEPRFLAAIVIVVGVTIALIAMRRRWPAGLAAWSIYVIVVSPVLGAVQAGPQFVADRYSYLACLPFAVLLSAAIAKVFARPVGKYIVGAGAALLIALITLTARQIPIWRDSWSLWRAAADHDPSSWNANSNLGSLYLKAGDLPSAERHFRLAVAAVPEFAMPTVNLAWCLGRMGKADESLALLRRAATMSSASDNDMLLIASGLNVMKQPAEARAVLERLLANNPKDGEAHFRLAGLLLQSGELPRAKDEYRSAVDLLEPSLLMGPIDLHRDMVAAMYAQSCRKLIELYSNGAEPGLSKEYSAKLKRIEDRAAARQ